VNATAISYTVDQGFEALEAAKSVEAKSNAYYEAVISAWLVADYLFKKSTGFPSLNDCLDAQGHGYRPTFNEDGGKDRETVFLAEVYDFAAGLRGLPLRAYRPEQAKPQPAPAPEKLTLQSIKDKLRKLRDEAHPGKIKHYPCIRSGGNELRLLGDNGFYEYFGEWKGTLKELKFAAERCRSYGGDHVDIGGQWLCCETLDGDYEPCDGSEWSLELSVDEILAIGKKS